MESRLMKRKIIKGKSISVCNFFKKDKGNIFIRIKDNSDEKFRHFKIKKIEDSCFIITDSFKNKNIYTNKPLQKIKDIIFFEEELYSSYNNYNDLDDILQKRNPYLEVSEAFKNFTRILENFVIKLKQIGYNNKEIERLKNILKKESEKL